MDDYSYAAEQMKEIIINDYLRKHPDVKRHEIVTKTVNGRVIVETITSTFNKLSEKNKEKSLSPKEKKLLSHLAQGGDVRYASTLDSAGSCRQYVDWLLAATFAAFTENDHVSNMEFLEKREIEAGKRAQELLYVRKKFTDQMSATTKPSRSLIQTLMMEYIASVMRQLKVQSQCFGKEIELGKLFNAHVKTFLRDNFDRLSSVPEKVIATIGKAFKILQKGSPQSINVTGKEDHKKVQELLDKQHQELSVRRQEYEMIKQLIAFLENMLNQMNEPEEEAPPPKKEQSGSTRRMAFHARKGRRGR